MDASGASVTVAGRAATSTAAPREINGHLLLPSSFLTSRLGLRIEATSDPSVWRLIAYGRYLKVRKNSPSYVVGTTTSQAACAAQVIDGLLYVPAQMLAEAFGIAWSRPEESDEFCLHPPGATVQNVREGIHDDYLRLVIDLSGPAPFWQSAAPGVLILEIPPPETRPADWGALALFTFRDRMGPRATVKLTDCDWTRLVITYKSSRTPSITTLGNPDRIVVDIPREAPRQRDGTPQPPEVEEYPAVLPAAATPWHLRHFTTERGVVRIFVLQATPAAIRPALASATIRKRAPVRLIAAREGASAAVNGGYFARLGAPLGLLVIDGEWIKHPMFNRCALGITETGKALMGRLRLEGAVRIQGLRKLDLSGLNTGHRVHESAIVYTRRWGAYLEPSPTKTRLVISAEGTVTKIEARGAAVAIPAKGYVLSAGGQMARELLKARVGTPASVTLASVPHWPRLRHALGAGPQLVKDNQRQVTAQEEMFRADVSRVASRTAVGITAEGNVLVAAAEARIAGGLSLWELASVMWKLGCRDAMALDGGGSSTVVARGRVINHPTDGIERPVSNALLIFGQANTP